MTLLKKQFQKNNIITNWMGFSFPSIVKIVGIILILTSIPAMFNSIVLGFVPAFFGIVLTSSFGNQIDVKKGLYRDYGQYAFFKTGKWLSTNQFSCIVITNANIGHKLSSWYGDQSMELTKLVFQVCLMTPDHRKKHVVQRFSSEKKALEYARELVAILELELVAFNPTISQKTRSRRR